MRNLGFVVVIALLSLTALVGCSQPKGFTDCGGLTTCQPGQYCLAPGICENGCTSDVNCADGQDCANEGDGLDGEGVCIDEDEDEDEEENEEGEGDGGEGEDEAGNALDGCLDACTFFQGCGMDAGETAQCRNDCPDLSENQQLAVAGCANDTCSDARTCLGIDCFSDNDCGIDEQCLGNSCL